MIRLFYQNYKNSDYVPLDFPLESCVEQAVEIFETLPRDDGSYMGLITQENEVIEFDKYDRFFWLVEIPVEEKKGCYQAYCNYNQCIRLIKGVFAGKNPFGIIKFDFESDL